MASRGGDREGGGGPILTLEEHGKIICGSLRQSVDAMDSSRHQGLRTLQQMATCPGFCLVLIDVMGNEAVNLNIRIIAAIYLKNHTDKYWVDRGGGGGGSGRVAGQSSGSGNGGRENTMYAWDDQEIRVFLSEEEKVEVRGRLLRCFLSEAIPDNVLSHIAVCTSSVARCDLCNCVRLVRGRDAIPTSCVSH